MAQSEQILAQNADGADDRVLLAFDFDLTIVDADTDRWGPEVLAPQLRLRMEELAPTWQWTDLVCAAKIGQVSYALSADTMQKMHEQGISRQQIEDAQRNLYFVRCLVRAMLKLQHPAMKRALRNVKKRFGQRVVMLILSNSNQVFIETILKHHGLTDIFDEVITNRAHWDESGLLVVQRRMDRAGPQHSCHVGCSPNMCKGLELDAFVKRHGGFDRFRKIVYSGDGSNDLCPILRLRSTDVAFVRQGYGLEKRILKEGDERGLKAERRLWAEAWQAEILFDLLQ